MNLTHMIFRFTSRDRQGVPSPLPDGRGSFVKQENTYVFAGTIVLAFAALGYILRFSVNAPVVDEWDLTHVLLGGMTLWDWSFTRLNEHLFIPANAVFYLLHKVSGLDFRVGTIANLLAHTAAAIILLRTARRLRGRTSLADLILSAALLHWGHAYNLLMSYQLAFGLFAVSAAIMLWVIATAEPEMEGRTATRGSFALLLLMLNGGMGIAFVPALAVWIGVLAWKAKRILPFALLALAGMYAAIALFGATKASATPNETIPLGRLAWCVVQYLGIGSGLWYDGPHWPRNGIIIAAGYAIILGCLVIATLRRRDGGRSAGFLLFLLGHFAVAGGIAVSRGGGLAERYVTISAIGIVAAYLGALSCGPPTAWLKWLGLAVAIALFTANIAPGEHYGYDLRSLYRRLERDLRAGVPIGFLRDKYQTLLRVGDNLEPALERLRTHKIREFTDAVPTPRMIDIPIEDVQRLTTPSATVLGIRAEVEVVQANIWSEVRVRWMSAEGPKEAVVYPPRSVGVYRLRLWVNDLPRGAQLTAAPNAVRIRGATWLLHAETKP